MRIRRSLLLIALTLAGCAWSEPRPSPAPRYDAFVLDQGGIIRGNRSRRELALVFTADEYADGCAHIRQTLADRGIRAAFFLTGRFLRDPERAVCARGLLADGHYLGPHSDEHLLYAPWEDRGRSLVSREEFTRDLLRNIAELRAIGALPDDEPVYFIPPYEWYNAQHVRWAAELGVIVINFTPRIGSNRDWAPEGHRSFVPSQQIIDDIFAFESRDPAGLNGAILLLHLGSQRQDKTYRLLGPLLDGLRDRGYRFPRIDVMLRRTPYGVEHYP